MSLADDLLDVARHLANLEPEGLQQASRRRAVSTAYYALFHLPISEATLNWNRAELRSTLGRLFEHGKMLNASEKKVADLKTYFKDNPPDSPERTIAINLHKVSRIFVQAQQQRNLADYETSREWTQIDVLEQIEAVSSAFESWKAIRDEPWPKPTWYRSWARTEAAAKPLRRALAAAQL